MLLHPPPQRERISWRRKLMRVVGNIALLPSYHGLIQDTVPNKSGYIQGDRCWAQVKWGQRDLEINWPQSPHFQPTCFRYQIMPRSNPGDRLLVELMYTIWRAHSDGKGRTHKSRFLLQKLIILLWKLVCKKSFKAQGENRNLILIMH